MTVAHTNTKQMDFSECGNLMPDYFENFNLESIVTPVKVKVFTQLLTAAGYLNDEVNWIRNGFTHGFDIGYQGPQCRQSLSNNIPLKIGNKTELWNKLMKEVNLKRVVGPFNQIPYDNFIQSPIGWYLKQEAKLALYSTCHLILMKQKEDP